MFLVRSGILTSVHSFALDPERGLILLLITLAISLYSFFIFFRSDISDNNSLNYIPSLILFGAVVKVLEKKYNISLTFLKF